MPRRKRLTDAGIARLRPEPREYTVWDSTVPGLGVRVRPSGARTYIQHRKSSTGVKKVSLGPATLRAIEEVRRACIETAMDSVETSQPVRSDAPLFREFVAGPWKTASYDRCKPSTRRMTRSGLKRQLLPAFGAVRLDRISRVMVVRWFGAYSATAPGGANRVLDILRQILNHAVACGHIATNPARTIRRNRSAKRTRFLSREEIRRLHRVLADHAHAALRIRASAGGHHSPSAVDGLPKERNRAAALGGSRRRPSQSERRQDRSETRLPQSAGTDNHRTPHETGRQPLGLSFGQDTDSSSG